MTGRGPLPKSEGTAARSGPAWAHVTDDGELHGNPLPATRPDGDAWRSETLGWWLDVRRHPVAKQWGPMEWQSAYELAVLHDAMLGSVAPAMLAEARRRGDDLGLSIGGRARLRITIVDPTVMPTNITTRPGTMIRNDSPPAMGRRRPRGLATTVDGDHESA